MKIIVISSHTPSLFWFRIDMMKSFIEKGHQVVAVGNQSEEKWKEQFAQSGIKYLSAQIVRNGTNPLSDIKTYRDIKRILKKEKPDRIFSYQAKTVIYGGIAAKRLGIDKVFPLIAGMGSVFLSNDIKSRLVRTLLKTEYKISLRNAEKVFFQNDDDIDEFVRNKLVKKEQVVKINGSGVNLDFFKPEPVHLEPVFLCVARLIRDKGIMEYLDAAKIVKQEFPGTKFLLVGPFDSNPSALKESDIKPYIDSGIVEYFGEQRDIRPYLKMCSVFVLPSYREGTPKTVLEAMASARAIITTDAPGCRETVVDGKNGYLVEVKDIKSLANAMRTLINDENLIKAMSSESRKVAEGKYDIRLVNKVICETMQV